MRDDYSRKIHQRIIGILDLVIDGARHHKNGYNRILCSNGPEAKYPRRPQDENVAEAKECIYRYIQESDDSQFTLKELMKHCNGYVPHQDTIISKLKDHYGDNIIISTQTTYLTIIAFKDSEFDVVSKSLYENRSMDTEDEKKRRIVSAAADILRSDIRPVTFRSDYYPESDKIPSDMNKSIPEN